MILYGIPNCNTVKKSQIWLKDNGYEFYFHDFKKRSITAEKLGEWCGVFGWEKVLNRNGTTWKKLSDEEKNAVQDESSAIAVMIKNNSAIKRPVLEIDGKAVSIGLVCVITNQ